MKPLETLVSELVASGDYKHFDIRKNYYARGRTYNPTLVAVDQNDHYHIHHYPPKDSLWTRLQTHQMFRRLSQAMSFRGRVVECTYHSPTRTYKKSYKR